MNPLIRKSLTEHRRILTANRDAIHATDLEREMAGMQIDAIDEHLAEDERCNPR